METNDSDEADSQQCFMIQSTLFSEDSCRFVGLRMVLGSYKLFLLPLSWLYGLVVILRNWMFDIGMFQSHSVGVPVISVGNLTVGGSGKTPIVEYVVSQLLEAHYKVAVVSRGYKRETWTRTLIPEKILCDLLPFSRLGITKTTFSSTSRASKGTVIVSDGRAVLANPQESGDEPFQIARKFPSAVVIVDEDRVRGARRATEQYGVQVVVLDDGFQHRSIRRDLDILVVDVERPLHTMWLLPAGIRREPISSVKRAHTIVLSRWMPDKGVQVRQYLSRITDVPQFGAQFVPKVLVQLMDESRLQPPEIQGKSCFAFCGIARPEVFEQTVKELGLQVKGFRTFPDHYQYTSKDIESLLCEGEKLQPDLWLTTEKDAVRLLGLSMKQFQNRIPVYYVELKTRLSDSIAFSNLLQQTITRYRHAHSNH